MSIKDQTIKGLSHWYDVLVVPALVLLIVELIRPLTPIFDSLPTEFGGYARLAAALTSILGIIFNKSEKLQTIKKFVVPFIAALGLVVLMETGCTYLLDAALLIMLVLSTDYKLAGLTTFSISACTLCATFLCAYKGYIREYSFMGHSSYGFINLTGLFIVSTIILVTLCGVMVLYSKDKLIKKMLSYFVYTAAVSAVFVLVVLKALNLAAAVEAGTYEIYGGESILGIEARMEGFEDFKIGFGNADPTDFTITPDGDNYLITMDSYGVTKTLCVIDGMLYMGNYEQATEAHTWNITAVRGTPYFRIFNVETGLGLVMNDDGVLELETDFSEDDGSLLRIGDENIDYYRSINTDPNNDLAGAVITAPSEASYTGSAVTLSGVTVELDGIVLQEGRDYEVSYWDNYIPGTAHMVITGKGDFNGTRNISFEIVYDDDVLDDPFYRDTADYIVRMFRMAYMRLPDIEEVRTWAQALIGGNRTPDSVIWEVYLNGGFDQSDAAFMEAVYRLMLLRNGSRGELLNWINELQSGATREDVINEISVSPDYQNIWHNFGIGFR